MDLQIIKIFREKRKIKIKRSNSPYFTSDIWTHPGDDLWQTREYHAFTLNMAHSRHSCLLITLFQLGGRI